MKGFICLFMVVIFPFSNAKAFFVEPLVGYTTGEMDIKANAMSTTISDSYDLNGLSLGLRTGFESGSFQLGAEYLLNGLTTSGGDLVTDDDTLRVQELSAFLGYRFWFMRLYGAFIFNADDNDSEMDGSGYKAGLTFYPLKNMGLNVEYKAVELDGVFDGVTMNAKLNTLSLLVSFPFSF